MKQRLQRFHRLGERVLVEAPSYTPTDFAVMFIVGILAHSTTDFVWDEVIASFFPEDEQVKS